MQPRLQRNLSRKIEARARLRRRAAKAGATQGTFTTSDAIPWKPADPKKPDGVQMFVVWGNPNKGASEILLKFPAGTDVGWHWHTAAYQGVVIHGKLDFNPVHMKAQ